VIAVSGGKLTLMCGSDRVSDVPVGAVSPVPPDVNDQCVFMSGENKGQRGQIQSIATDEERTALCATGQNEMALEPLRIFVKYTAA
jgi:hypothetical protein